ncbi:MAG TPA: VOC family protein [Stellaceae bacterium]|nr:VOC family protein [Stellaceae bacterium]
MSIIGIESIAYGVEDVATSARFFEDFGLPLARRDDKGADFHLAEGSSVRIRTMDDPTLPAPFARGPGLRELVWGVDTEQALDGIATELGRDRALRRDNDGTIHTNDDAGIAVGFRLYPRKTPQDAPQSENGLATMKRWNQLRKWYHVARPQVLHHAVFFVPDVDKGVSFYTKRLNFRVTDMIRHAGVFMRCDGRPDHHNLFFIRAKEPRFNHVAFGVENIDEMMTGLNIMQRNGWTSREGLGRHRATSIIFCYMDCPAGGTCEYMCDSDYLTDAWQPNLWEPGFANYHWLADWDAKMPAPEWKVKPLPTPVPSFSEACALPE